MCSKLPASVCLLLIPVVLRVIVDTIDEGVDAAVEGSSEVENVLDRGRDLQEKVIGFFY